MRLTNTEDVASSGAALCGAFDEEENDEASTDACVSCGATDSEMCRNHHKHRSKTSA